MQVLESESGSSLMSSDGFAGIHFMLPTPFRSDGAVDADSLVTCVEHAKSSGCAGVVALGVMGEAHRLLDSERDLVVETVVGAAGGELKVSVGISGQSSDQSVERLRSAQEAGADAVMASPPSLSKPNDAAVARYYADIDSAARVPLIVQDLPEQTGVHMSAGFIAGLGRDLESASMLKLEDPPTPPKVSATLSATGGSMLVFGGLGGSFLFEELRRGASGAMTGFAYPEVLVAIHRSYTAGDVEGARRLFYDWLPLIRYENSVGLGLSIRKHLLVRRGLISTATVRPPTPSIDSLGVDELEDVILGMSELIVAFDSSSVD